MIDNYNEMPFGVNVIDKLNEENDKLQKENEELYKFTLERIPMKKWGNSKDFVNASLFLSCEASEYITGEIINVDGGWSAW